MNWPFAKTRGDGDQAAGVIGRLVTPPDDLQVRTDEDWVSPVDAAGRIPLNQDDLERNAARSERRLDGRALRTVGEVQFVKPKSGTRSCTGVPSLSQR